MRAKIISSLEKCFLDENILSKPALTSVSMLKNERYSLQVCFDIEESLAVTKNTKHIDYWLYSPKSAKKTVETIF